jgi:hypothetical protein
MIRHLIPQSSASDFEAAAGGAFKGVAVALIALCLYPQQTHFYLAFWAEKHGFGGCIRERAGLCEWTDVSHGTTFSTSNRREHDWSLSHRRLTGSRLMSVMDYAAPQ